MPLRGTVNFLLSSWLGAFAWQVRVICDLHEDALRYKLGNMATPDTLSREVDFRVACYHSYTANVRKVLKLICTFT